MDWSLVKLVGSLLYQLGNLVFGIGALIWAARILWFDAEVPEPRFIAAVAIITWGMALVARN